jgi:hypothetical protein
MVAVAWTFSDEKFFKTDFFKWLNYGKLRVSYGSNGNRLPRVRSIQVLRLPRIKHTKIPYRYPGWCGSTNNSAIYVSSLQNDNLSWERTTGPNIGLDFSMLNNRLTGSIDVYDRKTTDMIVSRSTLLSRV